MKKRTHIPLLIGLLVGLTALLIAAGCGGGQAQTTSTLAECDPNAPSLIPPVQGRPLVVEFYKDT